MANKKYTAEQKVEYNRRKVNVKVTFKDAWIKSPRLWVAGFYQQSGKEQIISDISRWNNFYQGQNIDFEYLEMCEKAIEKSKINE